MDCVMINYTILCTHWSMDGRTYDCPLSSQYTPSPPLLYFISSFADAPCLWNIKITMAAIREIKQMVLGSLLINNKNSTRFEIAF